MNTKSLVFVILVSFLGCAQEGGEQPESSASTTEVREDPRASANDDAFRMEVLDSFSIHQRGVVGTGQIASGRVRVGDLLCLIRSDGEREAVTVAGLEQFRKIIEEASAGDNVGVLFETFDEPDLAKGGTLMSGSACR